MSHAKNGSSARVRLTSLSLLVMPLILGSPTADADDTVGYGCFSRPLELDEAQLLEHPGPIHAVLCPDPWQPPCNAPESPTIEWVHKRGTWETWLPNEVRIWAPIPEEGSTPFRSIRVQTQTRPDQSSPWSNLWSENNAAFISSRDAMRPEYRVYGGAVALFGATGLSKGRDHRVRVGFCREEDGLVGCTCWSDWGTAATPHRYTSAPVEHDASAPQRLEEYFERRESYPKRDVGGGVPVGGRGDGAGPDDAWKDEWLLPSGNPSPAGNGVRITEDPSGVPYALIPQGGALQLTAREALDPHSWAEVEFRSLDTGQDPNPNEARNYNFELHARFLAVGTPSNYAVYSYMVKLIHEPDFGDPVGSPTVQVYRNEGTPLGTTADPIATKTLVDIASDSTADSCAPEDIAELESGNVDGLLQMRVENVDLSPHITSIVAWGCDLWTCAHVCEWSYKDVEVSEGDPLYEATNRWALMSHHWALRADVFRVGSGPSP